MTYPRAKSLNSLSLELLRNGVSNSDRMRDAIRRRRKLILSVVTGAWNASPTNKFVNEHAWCLEDLVVRGLIERLSPKEYRLL